MRCAVADCFSVCFIFGACAAHLLHFMTHRHQLAPSVPRRIDHLSVIVLVDIQSGVIEQCHAEPRDQKGSWGVETRQERVEILSFAH